MLNFKRMFAEAYRQAFIASLRGIAKRKSHEDLLKSINTPTI